MATNLIRFIKEDVWLLSEHNLPRPQALCVHALKVICLAIHGFQSDLCLLRASALTLYSLLSIVPIIAMLFGIAKGFGFEQILEQYLVEHVPNQEKMMAQLIGFAQNLLNNTKGEVVAGIGVIALFWTIISVIGNIEASFNAIWKITRDRPMARKFSDYLSLMLLAPILLIVSSSLTVFLQTEVTGLMSFIPLPKAGAWLILKALSLTSLVLMIGLFTFTLMFMPNHKIQFRAGFLAGVVTGIVYQVVQQAYISLQVGVSSYNAIYGSFAALPLFIAWLQIGWMIVLLGCEIAFYLQNYEIYQNHNRFNNLSFSLKKVLALQVTQLIIKNFQAIQPPLNAGQIASKLVIPIAVVYPVLNQLISSHIVVSYKTDEDEDEVYQPALDINHITIAYVINALESCGRNHLSDIKQEQAFMETLNRFRELMDNSDRNTLLKDCE